MQQGQIEFEKMINEIMLEISAEIADAELSAVYTFQNIVHGIKQITMLEALDDSPTIYKAMLSFVIDKLSSDGRTGQSGLAVGWIFDAENPEHAFEIIEQLSESKLATVKELFNKKAQEKRNRIILAGANAPV